MEKYCIIIGPILLAIGVAFLSIGFQEKRRVTPTKLGKRLMRIFSNEKPGELIMVGTYFVLFAIGALSPILYRFIFPPGP